MNVKVCTIPECGNPHYGNGLCRAHYQRVWKYGSPMADVPLRKVVKGGDLQSRLDAYTIVDEASGCWLWTGPKDADGYGRFKYKYVGRRAHVAAWELVNGPVPSGMLVCHSCDTPACRNPAHLFLGAPAANSADMVSKDRQAKGTQHGGHKLTEADVLAIRADHRKRAEIAADFGITDTNVGYIKSRRIWRHI